MDKMDNKILKLNNSKKIVKILLFIFFIGVMYLSFYVELIQDSECGPKSKILYTALAIFVSAIIAGLIIYFHKQKDIKVEKIFLIAGTTIGLIYMLATPMFKGHDEQYHWYKSYAVSMGHFIPVKNDEGQIGDMLPRMVEAIFLQENSFLDINYKTIPKTEKYSINSPKEEGNDIVYTYNAPTAPYSPIQMMPQALGILISRILGVSTYAQAYVARFFNLIFFILTGYFGIKWSKNLKWFLLAFLLSPKIMYLSSTMSGDVFINGVSLLFITLIMKIRREKKLIDKKTLISLLILAPCVAIGKIVYFPLLALTILIPKESFSGKAKRNIYIILVILLGISVLGAWELILIRTGNVNSNELGGQQIKFAINHPIEYGGILIRNFENNFVTWAFDIVGGYMEWGSKLVQPEIISIFVYFILLLTIMKKNDEKFKISEIIVMVIVVLVIMAAIFSSMYLLWTPTINNKIGGLEAIGVQGRYFVPIMLLIAILIPKKYISISDKINNNILIISILLWQIPSLLNIFVRNI